MKQIIIETDGNTAEVTKVEITTKEELTLIMKTLVKYINEHPLP